MSRYPLWKAIIIILALSAAALYAVPNLFGQVPTVQVASTREAIKIDQGTVAKAQEALKAANITFTSAEIENKSLQIRFDDSDAQFKARDVIQKTFPAGSGYSVAPNLLTKSPAWLSKIGANPMALGLDLRGGVHFVMQVDMKKAQEKSFERYASDIRLLARDKKLYGTAVERQGEQLILKFSEPQFRAAAKKEITDQLPDLVLTESEIGGQAAMIGALKPEVAKREAEFALQQNIQTLRNRVNELGVAEPIIQQQGADRIIVELPGAQDVASAKETIGRVATLEIRNVAEEYASGARERDAFETYRNTPAPSGTDKFLDVDGRVVLVRKAVVVTGERVKDAQPNFDQQRGTPVVSMRLDEQGGSAMRRNTRDNVGKRMAMMLIEKNETKVLTWPTIQEEFGAQFQITGMESTKAATDLALLLRAGALAAPMDFIEERTVGPSLGKENIDKGFNSVLWGFIAIAVFMILYYHVFGVVSVIALASNLMLLLALLSLLQATITLPGIAAIALTLGMAIDANVLINERIREELRSGMSPAQAISVGYERAFDTILDSNITTLIAGIALLVFGSGPVRGFAVVHCLGILTSIFSAVMVSRGMVHLIYGRQKRLSKIHIGNTQWRPDDSPGQGGGGKAVTQS